MTVLPGHSCVSVVEKTTSSVSPAVLTPVSDWVAEEESVLMVTVQGFLIWFVWYRFTGLRGRINPYKLCRRNYCPLLQERWGGVGCNYVRDVFCGVEDINTNKCLHYIVKYGANYFFKSYCSLKCLLYPATTPEIYCTTFWLNYKMKGLCVFHLRGLDC